MVIRPRLCGEAQSLESGVESDRAVRSQGLCLVPVEARWTDPR